MAVINDPNVAANIAGVGAVVSKGLHTIPLPVDVGTGGWYHADATSGTIGAALAANSELFQFRFVAGTMSLALVYRVMVSAGMVAVATAAGPVGLSLVPARVWTGIGSGGTRLSLAGNNAKMRTSFPTSQVSDIGIATTAALTVGTKTLDTVGQGNALAHVGTAAVTAIPPGVLIQKTDLLDADGAGQSPLVLAGNEGFIIKTTHAGPAGLTYVIGVTIVWAEVAAF